MSTCPSCGADVQAGARFCAFCGTALAAAGSGEDMLNVLAGLG
jgi:hypothetical protein